MDLYFELMQYPVFSMDTVKKYYDNEESGRSALKRLIRRNHVQRIRNNMYTCISGESMAPLANRFQIASSITKTACVSYHTAMEYYGVIDQVFYEVYVSSETKFNTFIYDGYTYTYVPDKISLGIEKVEFSGGVRITDKERTIVDTIK
jgi:predicted transcriptional regulator of viral defense system